MADASGAAASTNNDTTAATSTSAAPSLSAAAPSRSLPGYYTAYLAQQQSAAAAVPPAGGYYPADYSYPHPYQSYPQQQPPPGAAFSAPSSAEAAAATSAPASAASPEDAAAYAEYQRKYWEWYQQHYLPYSLASAHAQQYAHYTTYSAAPSATSSPQPPTSTPPSAASSPPSSQSPTHPPPPAPATPYPHTAQQPTYPPHPAYQSPYPYPSHAAAAHPPNPTTASSHPSSAPPAHPPANAPSSQPPSSSTSRRSRWSAEPLAPSSPSAPPPQRASSTSTAPPPDPAAVANAWPPSVIDYVKRSLQYCPPHAKADVERYVRDRLQAAVNSGEVHRIDWTAEPLAHLRVIAEELKAKKERGELALAAQEERKRIDEQRLEWEQRRAREAAEEERRRQDYYARHAGQGRRKRGRDSDEKQEADSFSSEDDEKDVHHYFSSHSLSSRERRKERRRPSNGGSPSPSVKSELSSLDPVDQSRNRNRASRFSAYLQAAAAPMKSRIRTDLFTASQTAGFAGDDDDAFDWGALKIVGTSTSLEKSYFRLTSAPDPATVRPPHILYQALARLLSHWRTQAEYAYLCDQMKAIRQDLTVQHIRDEFTVRVYEEHARVAVEVGDLSEYNQCQTQLRQLYQDAEGQGEDARAHEVEFLMYRLCYHMITNNQAALNTMLRELAPSQRTHPALAHVLDLRKAVAASDFYHFLRSYKRTPYKGVSLLQHLAVSMRLKALTVLVRAYKPTRVGLDMFVSALGFDSRAECAAYVTSCGAIVSEDGEVRCVRASHHATGSHHPVRYLAHRLLTDF